MELSFLVLLLLLIITPVVVSEQDFLSIDCGVEANYSGNTDKSTGIVYVSDEPYTDAGENCRVAPDREGRLAPRYLTLRSFPSGVRNCYALPTVAGTKYLVRVEFSYGNYDGKNSSSLEFDVYLGANFWETFYLGPVETSSSNYYPREAIFVAWAGWVPLCLVNTGRGTPFVNVVELRPLGAGLYPQVAPGLIISMYSREDMGANVSTWYPADPYGRLWWDVSTANNPQWVNESTTQAIEPADSIFGVPSSVLQTAIAAAGNSTVLTAKTWQDNTKFWFMLLLYFADFQNTQFRQFDIYLDDNRLVPVLNKAYSPSYLSSSSVYVESYRATDGKYSITLASTNTSVLPPMINALEIYLRVPCEDPTTLPKDFDAIMAIKIEYGVKKNWMGDPCFPTKYTWEGVKCSNPSGNTSRIISLDLSNSSLHGTISKNFTLLTALENLDLSYNQLSGPIPDSLPSLPSLRVLNVSGNQLSDESLCKNYTAPLIFRHDAGSVCNKPSPSPPRNKATIIAISVVVPVLVVILLLLAYFIWWEKRKPNVQPVPINGPTRDPEPDNASGSKKGHGYNLNKTENRQFTYKELEKFTNNFKKFIGQGGFGPVYYGRLEDSTEVAVKMRSESSSHGLDEFLAEVQSLTKVHHRNLVSLIGYCWEKDHLALVYEYMSQGSLFDHLRDHIKTRKRKHSINLLKLHVKLLNCSVMLKIERKNGVSEALNWRKRLQVVLEAAQGLDYLHKGCNLPIVHRDVKTNNILLGQNLQAKIADFGLSKTYLSDTQTHISATAAGTAGYMDPEYYHTGRLTESSDVYSFGVVLLEVATGKPPIVPGHGHIIRRVKQNIATGDISSIADVRLGNAYDISSMWKVIDTAMMCTVDSAAQRPTMATVVIQLKESLALEETREKDSSTRVSRGSDIEAMVSTFRPLAR